MSCRKCFGQLGFKRGLPLSPFLVDRRSTSELSAVLRNGRYSEEGLGGRPPIGPG